MNNIEITIIWHEDNPIAFWFGDKLIWETDKIVTEIDFLETKITLPLISAIKFSSIFLQGLTADRLLVLLTTLQIKINELRLLKTEIEKQEKQEVIEKTKDDFYCDKECNRSCDDWDTCGKDSAIENHVAENYDDADFDDENEE